jgi:hypothetical protein
MRYVFIWVFLDFLDTLYTRMPQDPVVGRLLLIINKLFKNQ